MTEEVFYSDIIFSKTPGEGGTVTSTTPAHRAVQPSSRSSVIFALGAAVCVLLVVIIGMGIATHFSTTLAMEMDNIYTGLQKPSEDVYSTINNPQGRTAGVQQGVLQCQSHVTEFSNAAQLYMNDLSKAEQQYKMNLTATENELKNERRIAGQYRNDLRRVFCVDPNTGKQAHMASKATSPPIVPVIVPGQERRFQGPTGGNVVSGHAVSRNAPPAWAIPPPVALLLPVAMLSDEKADTSHADSFSWGNSGCGNATMGNAVSR
ncbi:hypothetical protein EOD39_12169 [Acipenser ruthenus]|uniref:Uncharacterized protein n=1 Tax=Acipenser ruthenus TaxID=7906 RepID=A0A662YSF2_ACIRT|nr:hypothetical protein EOD39_12169 [Acipenser ruthenus]